MAEYFTLQGRAGRQMWWINNIICGVAAFAVSMMFTTTYYSYGTFGALTRVTNGPLYYGAVFLILARLASIHARRWQDQDKEVGWLALSLPYPALGLLFPNFLWKTNMGAVVLVITTIAALVSLGFLGFVPSDSGENTYGSPQVEGRIW